MQKKALVTGANGMLADALCPLLTRSGFLVYPTDIIVNDDIYKLDVRDSNTVKRFIQKNKPDIIFHLAAETDVDKCELNTNHAYETNTKATENIAIFCKEFDISLVFISTGAIFNGEKEGGYTELDSPDPINVYGKSKLLAEEKIRSQLSKYYIIRAGWMIGGKDKDKKFVFKIIQLLKTKKEISVVVDKMGSPTFTKDFAKGIINIVSMGKYGIYHCVNKGICTRFDIAEKIIEYLNKKDVILRPITSEAFPLPAPRGKSEALINYNLSLMGMDNMRNWEEALREYLAEVT